MGDQVNAPGLPHHRAHLRIVRDHPRIDERRDDPGEKNAIAAAIAVLYVAGVVLLVAFAFGVVA